MNSGIYAINVNNKYYVGSAINLKVRRHSHKKKLNNNYHPNIHLQRAYNKYQNFEFIVLEYCEIEILLERERYWIDRWNVCELGYNKRRIPNSNLGLKWSEETRAKMKISSKAAFNPRGTGRKMTEEEKLEISNRMKGRKWTPEQIQKRIATRRHQGDWHSPNTKAKISSGLIGNKCALKNYGIES